MHCRALQRGAGCCRPLKVLQGAAPGAAEWLCVQGVAERCVCSERRSRKERSHRRIGPINLQAWGLPLSPPFPALPHPALPPLWQAHTISATNGSLTGCPGPPPWPPSPPPPPPLAAISSRPRCCCCCKGHCCRCRGRRPSGAARLCRCRKTLLLLLLLLAQPGAVPAIALVGRMRSPGPEEFPCDEEH